MRGFMVGLLLLAGLSGCYYESETDLTRGLQKREPSVFFAEGRHTFVSRADGADFIVLDVRRDEARIVKRDLSTNGTDSPITVDWVATYKSGSGWNPDRDFHIAVAQYGSGERPYKYLPFAWAKDNIVFADIAGSGTSVASFAELRRHYHANRARAVVYDRVSAARGRELVALDDRRKAAAAVTTTRARTAPATGHLDVGDGVYVQGVFADELAIITRIDRATGRVKVRRARDYTTVWVSADRVITREQSVANDLGRGVVAIGVMVCIFNPDACQN